MKNIKKNILILFFAWLFYGFTIDIYALRVVSLMPSYSEIICDLGFKNSLVGVSSYSNWPQELSSVEKVGDYYKPDIEKIYALKPDMVFSGKFENSDINDKLKKLGLKVIEIKPEEKIEDIYDSVKIISKALNSNQGNKIISKMKLEIKKIKKNKRKKSVFFEIDQPLWTFANKSFINDILSLAGGKNIFSEINDSYFKTSVEEIVRRNPNIIITNGEEKFFYENAIFSEVSAVQKKKVYKLSEKQRDLISRPVPRITEIIKEMSVIINE